MYYNDLNKYSGNVALITEQTQEVSYKDLLGAADNIGARIKKRCLIFILCRNCFESVAGYLGLLRAGAVLVLVDETIDKPLLMNLLETYKPEYVYFPSRRDGFNINCSVVYSYGGYSLLKTDYDIDYVLHDDLAILLTTSGSTGSPKFVRLSYKNLNSNAEAIVQYLKITDADRPITTMPMSYSYALSIINSHLLKGASLILTETTLMDKYFWQIIKEYKATTFSGVPYIYEMLRKLRFGEISSPDLKYITQAGGKLSQELSEEFADICARKGIKFYVMYGQTEATARMAYLPCEYARIKAGSVGNAIPGGKFWLEDNCGNIIQKSDVTGELVYQGPNVSLGYAESCYDLSKGDENKGILHTGDIAKRDEDGFYYILGRTKRFLKMFGSRVDLNEVEQLIRAIGHDCVCSGTDDKMEIYLTKPEVNNQVRNYIAERTGINQAGFTIITIDEIPRNKSGKILYSALKRDKVYV